MSDSDGDFSDELLELAGATEKKRKRKQGLSKNADNKRRKASLSESDANEPESEEEDGATNPYPLDGKYTDELDRQRLLEMPEIEREDVLAQRLEEMQRIQDKRNLDQMLKAQKGGDDSVSKAAKRQHAVRGATKEKSRKLDELKARRKAKDDSKRTRNSPKRDRSSSPMEMETDDEDDEDGQISKLEQEQERDLKFFSQARPDTEPLSIDDLSKIRLTRDQLAKHHLAPWFEDYITGAFVRYLIGQEDGRPIYRVCEVSSELNTDGGKVYKINDSLADATITVQHGKSIAAFPMDKVSNSIFTEREFDRFVKVCEQQKVKLPNKRQIEKKQAQLLKLPTQPMTENDINTMLARKAKLQPAKQSATHIAMEKSRLNQERALAVRRNDLVEVAVLDGKLAELHAEHPELATPALVTEEEDLSSRLAKVNERNRKANLEAVRKAELQEMERKRRERRLAAQGGTPVIDPSARLKITPRLFASRSGTPNTHTNGTPALGATPDHRSISPLPPTALASADASPQKTPAPAKRDFASQVLDTLEFNLGDF
ncbi:plus-3-domain-containing protein [Auriscalpium vulgare]|uniref:Plus-3-domain-containing protein n=1 Tax=Auriscalpium vulgare TaxID=40419 RepID=A0ACB8RSJ9_9AGAM|nr:plus-3-domain-containing protein [Auriscalpium vulgare]